MIYKVWFIHPLDGKEVFTYITADSEQDAIRKAYCLDVRYDHAARCY